MNVVRIISRTVECYRGNFETGGIGGAARLTLAMFLCVLGPFYARFGGKARYCPTCGWNGSNFLPLLATGYVAFQVRCPNCDCAPRHRAHQLFYERQLGLMDLKGKLLYFAPESNVNNFRKNKNLEVRTSNYGKSAADYDIDIMDIPFEDNSWDYIVCHRVIEHIPDDSMGLGELLRILKPSGQLILSVPIDDSLAASVEYGKPNPLENDHYYNYGPDFERRIPEEFNTRKYLFSDLFSSREFEEMALVEDYLFVCTKPCVCPK